MKITLILATLVALAHALLAQNPPSVVNYQGRVTRANGQPLPDGTVKVEVNIYDSPLGGTMKWDSGEKTVNVRGGVFALALQGNGATTPALGASTFATGFTWFEVVVWDGNTRRILSPRQLIAGVPWSLWASTVSDESVTEAKIAENAVGTSKIQSNAVVSGKLANDIASLFRVSGGRIQWVTDHFSVSGRFEISAPAPDGAPLILSSDDTGGTTLYQLNSADAAAWQYTVGSPLAEPGSLGIAYGLGLTPPTVVVTKTGKVGINSGNPTTNFEVIGNSHLDGRVDNTFPNKPQAKVSILARNAIGSTPNGCLLVRGPNAPAVLFDNFYHVDDDFMGALVLGNDAPNAFTFTGPQGGGYAHVWAAGFNVPSSRRLKSDIRLLGPSLDGIMRLRPSTYNVRYAADTDSRQVGFVAEELADVFPDVVSFDGRRPAGISYNELVPILTKGLQEQQRQIAKLESKLRLLEDRLEDVISGKRKQ